MSRFYLHDNCCCGIFPAACIQGGQVIKAATDVWDGAEQRWVYDFCGKNRKPKPDSLYPIPERDGWYVLDGEHLLRKGAPDQYEEWWDIPPQEQ